MVFLVKYEFIREAILYTQKWYLIWFPNNSKMVQKLGFNQVFNSLLSDLKFDQNFPLMYNI